MANTANKKADLVVNMGNNILSMFQNQQNSFRRIFNSLSNINSDS